MRRSGKVWSWFWMILGILYFFLPLVATFVFSLKAKLGVLSFLAYTNVFKDPHFTKASHHRCSGRSSRSSSGS